MLKRFIHLQEKYDISEYISDLFSSQSDEEKYDISDLFSCQSDVVLGVVCGEVSGGQGQSLPVWRRM